METSKLNIQLLLSCWLFTIFTWMSFLDNQFFFHTRITKIVLYLLLFVVAVLFLFKIPSMLRTAKQKCYKEQLLYYYYFIILLLYVGSYLYGVTTNFILS